MKDGKFPLTQYINGQYSWPEAAAEVWQGNLETYEGRHSKIA